MTPGLKIWLWIVLVLNALSGVMAIATALLIPLMWIVVLAEALVVAGAAVLLFPRKKMGFYLICGGSAVGLIVNLLVNPSGIISAVFSAIIMPLIIWLLIKNTWYEFQ